MSGRSKASRRVRAPGGAVELRIVVTGAPGVEVPAGAWQSLAPPPATARRAGGPGGGAGRHAVSPGPRGGPGGELSGLVWPVGPHYLRWVEGRGAGAWARFKLKSADWYLDALQAAERESGRLDRFVGIEMAIDGVLASLCAGVDAAGLALLDEVRRITGTAVPDSLAHGAGAGWVTAFALARDAGIELASGPAVAKALRGDGTALPRGWLARLRAVQALAVQRNVLVRRPAVDDPARGRLLDVPGLGPRPLVAYLSKSRRRSGSLVEAVLDDLDALVAKRLRQGALPAGRGARPLPDLAARADLVPPPDPEAERR